MTSSAAPKKQEPAKALRAWVQDRYIYVELDDERRIGVPIRHYPKLRYAEPTQVANIRIRMGRALRWEELDEDILVADILAGNFPRRAG